MNQAGLRRLVFWIPPFVALIGVLAWLFRPQPVLVDLASAAPGPLQVSVSDDGETRVRDVFVVSAPVPGLMRRIELEAGDKVVADETVIARIEPSDPAFLDRRSEAEARAAVRASEAAGAHAAAELRRAEAERDFAQAELRRYEGLAEKHTVSLNDLDAARRRARTRRSPRSRRPRRDCACAGPSWSRPGRDWSCPVRRPRAGRTAIACSCARR